MGAGVWARGVGGGRGGNGGAGGWRGRRGADPERSFGLTGVHNSGGNLHRENGGKTPEIVGIPENRAKTAKNPGKSVESAGCG